MDTNADQALSRQPKTRNQKPKPPRSKAARRTSAFANLRVGQKLALLAVAFGIPVSVLVTLLVRQQQTDINFARLELTGTRFLPELSALQQDLATYVGTAIAARQRTQGAEARRDEAAQAVEARLAKIEALYKQYPQINVASELKLTRENFDSLKSIAAVTDAGTILQTYQGFNNDAYLKLVSGVANKSKLVLDPEIDSFYLMEALVNRLPLVTHEIAQLGNAADAAFGANALSPESRDIILFGVNRAESELAQIVRGIEFAVAENKSLEDTVGTQAQALSSVTQTYFDALRSFAEDADTFKSEAINKATLKENIEAVELTAIEALTAFQTSGTQSLTSVLNQRVTELNRSRNTTLLLIAGVLAIAAWLLLLITRAITRPLRTLTQAAQAVGQGNFNVNVPVASSDEIGIVGKTFNVAVEQLRDVERKNAQEREEAVRLQQNIGAFLDVTMDIADGDFTKRGRVTEDVLGNVVDSINVMVEELEQVLRNVREASLSVNQGADSMLSTTDEIVRGTETTVQAAQRVTEEVQTVISSIRQMAEIAQQSAQTAQLALDASQQGREAVESTLGGMQNIRREVQGISKRIKGLGDRSLEIQEIVDTIQRITRQTNMLALNAAIEAAGAGEAGGRFAIVADEVRKLAESSAAATGRIATLIKNVQAEIQEVVVSVEDGTREVEAGYRVAGTAGERLEEIAQLAQRSAELATAISTETQAQVQGVEQVGQAVGSIASVAETARENVNAGRDSAERLRQLAARLDEQLARFRLAD